MQVDEVAVELRSAAPAEALSQPQALSQQPSQAEDPNESVAAYNRKEKSLGELCKRFLYFYGTPQKGLLYLDQCTKELGVERRRIYDIINILESFYVIKRCAKNEYKWRGIDQIVVAIQKQIDLCVSTFADCFF